MTTEHLYRSAIGGLAAAVLWLANELRTEKASHRAEVERISAQLEASTKDFSAYVRMISQHMIQRP